MPDTPCVECGRQKRGGYPLCHACRETCRHDEREPGRIIKANGLQEVRLWCVRCWDFRGAGRNIDYDLDSLPVWRDKTGQAPPCVICGETGTELHHFAPRALFGEEAEGWPMAWLCRPHHVRWHRVMNVGAATGSPADRPDH